MRRGGGLRRQGSSSDGGSGRRFSTQTSGGGGGGSNGFGAADGADARRGGAPRGGGRPGLSHTGGSGRRGGRRPQVADLSDQEIRNMIQSSNVQYTVGLQLDVDKIDVLKIHVREFEELLKDPDQDASESSNTAVKTIPLAVFGLNDWEELIEFQRAVAGLQRPTRMNRTTGQEAEAMLESRARVSCDTRLMEWSYELSFSPVADDIVWTFTNELLLQLRSAGIYGRPLLPMRGSTRVALASAFSRATPFEPGGAQRLEWSGAMLWNQIVVQEQLGNTSAIVQSTRLPAVIPRVASSSESAPAALAASLRYPTLVPLVEELLKQSAKTRRPAVVILRGIPGSGKSTFGKEIAAICKMNSAAVSCEIFSADRFFIGPRGYVFDAKSIGKAHDACKQQFEDALRKKNAANIIVVDNTHTQLWEYEHYADHGRSSGCRVQVLEMHCSDLTTCIQMAKRNSHGVSLSKVIQMYLRWENDPSALSFTPQFEHAMINKNPISRSPASSIVYVGLFISSEERAKLLNLFPPIHANVFAEHVTIFYRPTKAYVRNVEIGKEVAVTVTELVQDERGQTLRVELADDLSLKLRNKIPHVTISTRQDVSAYYSNDLLEDARANRIPLSGEYRITIKARLGVAVLAQNQRSITMTSPFGKPEAALSHKPSGSSVISNIFMVCVDDESVQQALSLVSDGNKEGEENYLLARLALFEQIQHHMGSSRSTRRVICLGHNGGSCTDTVMKNLEELLLLCPPNRKLAFDKFVIVPSGVHQHEYVIELLKQEYNDVSSVHPVQKITVLSSLDEHLNSSFTEDECFQSAKVSVSKLAFPSLHADPRPSSFTAPFPLTLVGVMDCLNLGIQERIRHDIHTGIRLARDALQKTLGRDSSDAVVVERFDSSLVGLDAEVIDLCTLLDDKGDLDLGELQRKTTEALADFGVQYSLAGRKPGCVYFTMCANAASSPVFRLQILTSSEFSVYKRLVLCRKQRELVQQLHETETYTTLVVLLRAMLRSHCLSIASDPSLVPIADLMSERLVLEFLLQCPQFKQSAVGETNESGDSVEEPGTVQLLLQLLEFLGSWADSKWSNELTDARALFDEGSSMDRIQQSELSGAVTTCLDIFHRFDLETRGAIYRSTADKRSTELLQLLLALVQRKSETAASRREHIYMTDATNSLDAFVHCDAMREAAAEEDMNPMKSMFVCTPSLLVPKQIEIGAASWELLNQTHAAVRNANLDEAKNG